MRQEIHLFLNNQEVEFNHPLDLYYNYQMSEVNNPTVVKNGFSKTITIEGTPNNNNLFGDYWNVERTQGDGTDTGVRFNASKRVPFTLYYNSEIYESGYAKLDEVRLDKEKDVQYDITLYGGLGDFFYNLSTGNDGRKKKLSDLIFYNPSDPSSEFGFTTNMDTVKEAWDNMSNTGSMWSHINFMPAYNGRAVDFDNNKIICNLLGSEMPTSVKVSGVTYETYENNMVLGTLPKDMNEWEVRDLRSYFQRPVIRMKSIIDACCDQQNNGGYEVWLDPWFFTGSNPYYADTWMTLPMLTNLEYSNTQQVLTGQTLVIANPSGDINSTIEQEISFSLGDFSSTMKSLELRGTVQFKGLGNNKSTSHIEFWNSGGDSYHTGYALYGSIFVQLVAYNGETVVDASECYNLTSPIRHNGHLYYGNNSKYSTENQYTPLMSYNNNIQDILGFFKTVDNIEGVFCDEYDDPVVLRFHMQNLSTQITSLRLRYYIGASDDKLDKHSRATFYADTYIDRWVVGVISRFETSDINKIDFNDTYHNFKAVIGGSLGRTGTIVTKDLLLNTDFSPCDFFLNYCKTFGLYFYKDIDKNRVYVMSRDLFYATTGWSETQIETDLSDKIDRNKPIKITPITFDKKWYKFNYDTEPTALAERYLNAYGYDYGCRIYDTGYDFNVETKDMLDDNCYKTGIETVGKGRYYSTYSSDTYYRTWMRDGFSYSLYNGNNTEQITPTVENGYIMKINPNEGYSYYDMIPKLQFHDVDENPTDGKYVLVFFSGWKSFTATDRRICKYFLTDDNKYMTALNGGRPCWLFTPSEFDGDGNRLGYRLSKLPVFERYLTQANSNTIIKSLDFGPPRETYVPYYDYSKSSTICGIYWDKYISDIYSVDSKILSCYVHIPDKPNPDWLMKFFWFDNCLWRLSKIEDWNVSSFDTTKCEFIKVLDPNNYSYTQTKIIPSLAFELSDNTINMSGQTITGTITTENDVKWYISGPVMAGCSYSPTSGIGSATITITIPAMPSNMQTREFTFRAYTEDFTVNAIATQSSDGAITVVEGAPYAGRNVPATGGTCNLTVTSTYAWTVKSSRSTIKTYYNGSEITSATTMPSGTTEIQVVWPAAIRPSKKVISLNRTVLTFKDVYDYSVTWTKEQALAQVINFDSSGGSITIDYESGKRLVLPSGYSYVDNGDDTYTITAQPNYSPSATSQTASFEASDEIEDQTGQQVVYIQINQEAGAPFTVTPIVLNFPSSGDTDSITIINEMGDDWSVVGYPSWMEVISTSGNVVVTASQNAGVDREGTIVIQNTTFNTVYTVICYQEGYSTPPRFNVIPSVITYNITGGTDYINVINPNGDFWKVLGHPSWVTCTTAITGVTVEVGENTGITRSESIIITNLNPDSGSSFNVVCVQGGLTGISLDNLTWVIDIQSGGGTATSANTSFIITGYDDLGNTITIPSGFTVTGSVEVPRDTTRERHTAGTLTLTATYQGFTASASTTIWQMAYIPVLISIQFTDSPAGSTAITSSVTWTTDVAKTGGTATKANVFYRIIGRTALIGGEYLDLTESTIVTGSLNVSENPDADRRSAGTLTLTATYDNASGQVAETAQTTVTVYQEGNPKIQLSQSGYIDIPGSGGTGTFTVTSNIPFDIDINDINNS